VSVNSSLSASTENQPRKKQRHIRLTGAGWGFLALIFCELLMALNFNNNPLFAMTFLSAAIVFTAYWQTAKNVSQIGFLQWRVETVFAGQVLEYSLELRELGGYQHDEIRAAADIEGQCAAVTLGGLENRPLVIRRTISTRGRTEPASVNLASEYPLGLFRASLAIPPLPSVVIYPAAKGTQVLPESHQNETAHIKAEADTLSSLRRYQEGDRINRIAWKASARSMDLMSNEYDGADDPNGITLDWQQVQLQMVEEKLSQLCAWVLMADRQGLEYSLKLPGSHISTGSGVAHRQKCLQALALYALPSELSN